MTFPIVLVGLRVATGSLRCQPAAIRKGRDEKDDDDYLKNTLSEIIPRVRENNLVRGY